MPSEQRDPIQAYYQKHGQIVMASVKSLKPGPMESNDWNEDDMCQHRWSVVGLASPAHLKQQNAELGFTNEIDPQFRFFYFVVALD